MTYSCHRRLIKSFFLVSIHLHDWLSCGLNYWFTGSQRIINQMTVYSTAVNLVLLMTSENVKWKQVNWICRTDVNDNRWQPGKHTAILSRLQGKKAHFMHKLSFGGFRIDKPKKCASLPRPDDLMTRRIGMHAILLWTVKKLFKYWIFTENQNTNTFHGQRHLLRSRAKLTLNELNI
jgi:hypothetical protein